MSNMSRRRALTLADFLAELYPTRQDAERLCFAAGIDTSQIQMQDVSGRTLWYLIVRYAERTASMTALVEAALEEKPAEAALSAILRELREK